MKIELETGNGEVVIESEVIAQYAGLSAIECFGIVGMATVNMKDGFVKLLRGDSVSKGVNVTVGENNAIAIDFHIIVLPKAPSVFKSTCTSCQSVCDH